jgi:hypothetical protein
MSQHLYAGSATAAAGNRTASSGPGSSDGSARGPQSDEVIDVEFEEKR